MEVESFQFFQEIEKKMVKENMFFFIAKKVFLWPNFLEKRTLEQLYENLNK